jgi:hypothetical protein
MLKGTLNKDADAQMHPIRLYDPTFQQSLCRTLGSIFQVYTEHKQHFVDCGGLESLLGMLSA